MRVLVTGGAGFVGRAVTARLDAEGDEVVAYDRAVDAADDITDLARLRAAVDGCAAVVHLAAKVGLGVGIADIDDYARHNDLGTAVVLRASADAGITRLVFASSMVVYGEGAYECRRHGAVRPAARRREDLQNGDFEVHCPSCGDDLVPGLIGEDAPLDPRNAYAATKVHGEHLAGTWARETGGIAAALRFHNVYGPGLPRHTPYAGVAALFATRARAGEPARVFEDGRQRRDFVHVDDVARAVSSALRASLDPGLTALNIGSGRVTTIGEVAAALADAVGGPPPVVTGDFRLGDVRHVTADSAAARRVLGWCAKIALREGLRDLI
ncbi:MAG TPA: NAD-dependent epimerase/dehydratase family protein [Microlunatus sp.]